MSLHDLLYDVLNRAFDRIRLLIVPREPAVIVGQEASFHLLLQKLSPIGRQADVVLDALQEEPDRVSRIVPRHASAAQEIRDGAVADDARKGTYVFLRL